MQLTTRWEFGSSLKGLFIDTFGHDISPSVRERLRAAGLDLDRPLLPAYPAEQYVGFLRVLAQGLYPEVDLDIALRRLGSRAALGMGRSLPGRAVLKLISAVGIRQALKNINPAFRNANNYSQVLVREVEPNCMELEFNTVTGMPTYFEGVLLSGVAMLGGQEVRVLGRAREGERYSYLVSWKD